MKMNQAQEKVSLTIDETKEVAGGYSFGGGSLLSLSSLKVGVYAQAAGSGLNVLNVVARSF
jgi:hypothetical protein